MRLTADLRMYRHSGIGRYLRNIFPLLLPQMQADKVRVLGERAVFGDAAWLHDPRIEMVETIAPIYSVAEQMLAMRGVYRGSDLLWAPHYNAPLRYRGRMVVTIHDLAPIALPETLGHPIKRAYAHLLLQRATHQAQTVLCVSEFTKQELQTRLEVPAEKITVTPLGVDAGWPHQAEPHREPEGAPYLLYVGNVKPHKNLGLLLRAFAQVMERIPHRLVLAGKMRGFGTSDDAVARQAEAMGDRVRFAGEIGDAELMRLYAGAAAMVLPSRYEGFGLPMLEAMQLGCPVLASRTASLPEVGGEAALYFDAERPEELAACLLRVQDSDTMDELRRRGRQQAAGFSFARCAERTAEVLNRNLRGLSRVK